MFNKKVTIIITSNNSRHNLPDCLTSIIDQDYPKNLTQIIVIDNNSIDSSVGYVRERFPKIKIILNNKKVSESNVYNQGYFLTQKNKSDYLAIVDAATILEKNWLSRLIALLEKGKKLGMAGSKNLIYPEKKVIHSLGGSINIVGVSYLNNCGIKNDFSSGESMKVDFVPKEACVIKMSVINKIGFLNRSFHGAEMADLGWRMKLAGYKSIIDSSVVAHYRQEHNKNKNEFFHSEKNRLMMLLQNYKVISLLMLLPLLIFVEIGMIINSIAHKYLGQKLKSYLWILLHLSSIISNRINIQFNIRKIGDLAVLNFKK